MRLFTLATLVSSLGLGGCAIFSASPAAAPATMHSPPPAPKKQPAPRIDAAHAWVPGFYEPAFGSWAWHSGRVIERKPGYRVVEAQYIAETGEFHVRLPHWERLPVPNRPKNLVRR